MDIVQTGMMHDWTASKMHADYVWLCEQGFSLGKWFEFHYENWLMLLCNQTIAFWICRSTTDIYLKAMSFFV